MEVNKFWGDKILKWCIDNMGSSKFQSFSPRIRYYKKGSLYYGYYNEDKNLIVIYLNVNKSFDLFVKTIIHEYTHYQQNITGKYRKILKKNDYNSHPYEIIASKNEEIFFKKCKKDLKNLVF